MLRSVSDGMLALWFGPQPDNSADRISHRLGSEARQLLMVNEWLIGCFSNRGTPKSSIFGGSLF